MKTLRTCHQTKLSANSHPGDYSLHNHLAVIHVQCSKKLSVNYSLSNSKPQHRNVSQFHHFRGRELRTTPSDNTLAMVSNVPKPSVGISKPVDFTHLILGSIIRCGSWRYREESRFNYLPLRIGRTQLATFLALEHQSVNQASHRQTELCFLEHYAPWFPNLAQQL